MRGSGGVGALPWGVSAGEGESGVLDDVREVIETNCELFESRLFLYVSIRGWTCVSNPLSIALPMA